jgi:hypothetical protein
MDSIFMNLNMNWYNQCAGGRRGACRHRHATLSVQSNPDKLCKNQMMQNRRRGFMKAKKKIAISIFLLGYFIPLLALADEIVTDVIIVTKGDKILAFSGQDENWVSQNLKLKEKVIIKKAHGNVGVVITNERFYGFSVITGKWNIVELLIKEEIEELQAEGNVATVVTDQRTFGFNAHTGLWSEFK